MKSLVFATNNKNKIKEVEVLLPKDFKILSLSDISCFIELPENQNTLEGNALEKAEFVYDNFRVNCFSEDTGLEVFALNNEPGVYSARYAGKNKDDNANMELLLSRLKDVKDRSARFRTVIALIIDGNKLLFEGMVEGDILYHKIGNEGFGYDPIFQPKGYDKSFAELGISVKKNISHRTMAMRKLLDYLNAL